MKIEGIPKDAKVVVVSFVDWQCPPCRWLNAAYQPVLEGFRKAHPESLKVLLRDFPLNPDCNPGSSLKVHGQACIAAVAYRLASDKGKSEQMGSWLFENQFAFQADPKLIPKKCAELLGIDEVEFAKQYSTKLKGVQADAALGYALGLRSTPSYFINGVLAVDAAGEHLTAKQLGIVIEHELRLASQGRGRFDSGRWDF